MTTDRWLRNGLQQRFGMTVQDLKDMLDAQNHRCAICDTDLVKPSIDHDHTTGRVRALLCFRCNSRLTAIEDAAFVQSAQAYLAYHRQVTPTPCFHANPKFFQRQRRQKLNEAERRSA
jgi:uncharacterized protein with PIN domain